MILPLKRLRKLLTFLGDHELHIIEASSNKRLCKNEREKRELVMLHTVLCGCTDSLGILCGKGPHNTILICCIV